MPAVDNRRAVWILHYACAPIIGGVEGIMSEHARVLAAHGHLPRLVAGRGAPAILVPEIDSRHPDVLAVQAALDAGQVPAAFAPLRARIRAALGARLAAEPAGVVIVHNAFTLHKNLALTAALADLAAAGTARCVAWCHDLAWTNPLYQAALHPGPPWDLLRTPLPGVQYVAISEERQGELAGLFGWSRAQVRRVPNGIDPVRFLGASPAMAQVLERLAWRERDPVLLAPVRMTRRKNLELAIATVAALRDAGRRPLLLITGPPGPHNPRQDYAEFLAAERHRRGLDAEVVFLAQEPWLPDGVDDALMAELYRWADALLFPTLQEGFGLPMLEAGLARLPIFCTDLPVLRETGGPDVHYLAPETPPAAIAAAIQGVLEGPGAPALRRRVLRDYNWESIYRTGLQPLVGD
ncbi:MAG TPA: glycosyltransferase family 4 protein [Chloroflexia bacterium]|nr:glycosyltransferase family 4 protein [Chloroflexia bacterium]